MSCTGTVTQSQLAGILSVSRSTVHRMDAAGELPPRIPTKRRLARWAQSDIDLWLSLDCPDAVQFKRLKRDQQRFAKRRQ